MRYKLTNYNETKAPVYVTKIANFVEIPGNGGFLDLGELTKEQFCEYAKLKRMNLILSPIVEVPKEPEVLTEGTITFLANEETEEFDEPDYARLTHSQLEKIVIAKEINIDLKSSKAKLIEAIKAHKE